MTGVRFLCMWLVNAVRAGWLSRGREFVRIGIGDADAGKVPMGSVCSERPSGERGEATVVEVLVLELELLLLSRRRLEGC